MVGKKTHRRITRRQAGRRGRTEVPIPGGRRLDVRKPGEAGEVERSGNPQRIAQALSRLKTQRNVRKVLLVPQRDLDKAKDIAEKMKMNVLIQNLSKTRRRIVKK